MTRPTERDLIVAHLDQWAAVSGGISADYDAGWSMCAFNAAREIERGDHLPTISSSGIPITRRYR